MTTLKTKQLKTHLKVLSAANSLVVKSQFKKDLVSFIPFPAIG